LFGSRSRGDHEPTSDIDIAVAGSEITEREWLDLCNRVDEIETLLFISLVHFDTAPAKLQKRILQEGKVLYEHD
jgi:predicted nucleotidyltransferase